MILSADLRVEGFDAASWTALLSLFLPDLHARIAPPKDGPVGTLLIVEDLEHRILTAMHSARGPVRSLHGSECGEDLEALANEHAARRVVVIRHGTMEELGERIGLTALPAQGYVAQVLEVLRAVRSAMDAHQIRLWPNPAAGVPIPPTVALERALDLTLPRGRCILLAVYDDASAKARRATLETAAVVRRAEDRGLDWLAGPELLREWTGPTGGDWRRDFRVLVDSVARNAGPVHLGVFVESSTLRALLRGGDAGAWAREAAVRNIVFSPMPPALAIALGADAVRAAGRASARALGGIDFARQLLPLAAQLRSRFLAARTVTDELGFDPLRVLAIILNRQNEGTEHER